MAKRIQQHVMIGEDTNGKPIFKNVHGYTQQELFEKAAVELVKAGRIAGVETKTSNAPLFSEYIRTWFETFKVPKLKVNTARNYRIDIEKHINPFFEGKHIDQISTTDIQAFYNSKRHLAHSTVHCMGIIMHGAFQSAIEDGYITRNPSESKRLSMTNKKEERSALSAEAVNDIIHQLPKLQTEDRILLALLLFTGMRRGEMLGLRWEDIDWRNEVIYIQRSVMFCNNRPVLGDTKSKAGVRYVPLLPQLMEVLRPHRGIGFVVGGAEAFTQCKYMRTWKRIVATINLHGATAHVLRHSYITAAVPYVDIKTLQTIAGHADISTTLNRYAHSRQDRIRSAGHALQTMYQTLNAPENAPPAKSEKAL